MHDGGGGHCGKGQADLPNLTCYRTTTKHFQTRIIWKPSPCCSLSLCHPGPSIPGFCWRRPGQRWLERCPLSSAPPSQTGRCHSAHHTGPQQVQVRLMSGFAARPRGLLLGRTVPAVRLGNQELWRTPWQELSLQGGGSDTVVWTMTDSGPLTYGSQHTAGWETGPSPAAGWPFGSWEAELPTPEDAGQGGDVRICCPMLHVGKDGSSFVQLGWQQLAAGWAWHVLTGQRSCQFLVKANGSRLIKTQNVA